MSEDNNGFDFQEYLKMLGGKKPEGIFLTNVKIEDLDEQGRFICKEHVLVIGSHAFENVKDKLTYAKIDGVISIEDGAFANCMQLEKADIGFELDYQYLQNYDTHMFWKNKLIKNEEAYEEALEDFTQKFGLYDVHIKDGAFENCVRLQSFQFPSRVTIHGSPFRHCNSMTEISFGGSIRLQIGLKDIRSLGEYDMPFRAVTFRDCDNIQKMSFGKGAKIDIDEIAPFENLKEINLSCDFFDRRKFWKNAISEYPHFFLMLPSELYRNESFVRECLRAVPSTLEETYGYPACKQIYKKLIVRKEKIEKQKSKIRAKNSKLQERNCGGGSSITR